MLRKTSRWSIEKVSPYWPAMRLLHWVTCYSDTQHDDRKKKLEINYGSRRSRYLSRLRTTLMLYKMYSGRSYYQVLCLRYSLEILVCCAESTSAKARLDLNKLGRSGIYMYITAHASSVWSFYATSERQSAVSM